MPASVEILTKTHELVRTNVSIFVTLTLSLGPTWAAAVGCAVNVPSSPYSAPAPRTLPTQDRRSMFDDMTRSLLLSPARPTASRDAGRIAGMTCGILLSSRRTCGWAAVPRRHQWRQRRGGPGHARKGGEGAVQRRGDHHRTQHGDDRRRSQGVRRVQP